MDREYDTDDAVLLDDNISEVNELDLAKVKSVALSGALSRIKERAKPMHASHYTKHTSHAVKHSSTW